MLADRDEETRLTEAAKISMETRQMTPLIKEELRLSIIKKRHASGQEDIKVEFSEPKQYELTATEKKKRERRREQNRRAAQRCRQKKKMQQSGKQEVFSTVITENTKLQEEVKKLRHEKKILGDCLTQHLKSGCCRQRRIKQDQKFLPPATPDPAPVASSQTVFNINQSFPLPLVQHPTVLPSFGETFITSPSVLDQDVFEFPSDMRSELSSNRTWSGTSDDVIPPENLPEAIFDDVFYDNESFLFKLTAPEMTPSSFQDSLENIEDINMAELQVLEPYFDASLVNEP